MCFCVARPEALDCDQNTIDRADEEEDLLRPAAEVVAVRSIGEAPPDGPVGGRPDERVQHVLDQDVHSVL